MAAAPINARTQLITETSRRGTGDETHERLLTGRAVKHRKTLVDRVHRLDTATLTRAGVFKLGLGTSWTYPSHCPVLGTFEILSIHGLLASGPTGQWMVQLDHEGMGPDGSATHECYFVQLDSTPCYFGGRRYWWMCPLVVNGQPCARRCRMLYLPRGSRFFGCRLCHRLTYQAQQWHRDRFYEGLLRPQALLEEELRRPYQRLSPKQRVQRLQKYERLTQAADRLRVVMERRLEGL